MIALIAPGLPLAALLPTAAGVQYSHEALFQGSPVQTLELNFSQAAAPGATFYLPLNASARVVEASFVAAGSPGFESVLLTGDGAAARSGEGFGFSMEGRGDYNGDGFADLVVGAPFPISGTTQPGRADVYYGSARGVGLRPNWSYIGPNAAQFASPVAHGDVNEDGFDDLILGEEELGFRGTPPESVLIFNGSPAGLPATPGVRLTGHDATKLTGWSFGMLLVDLNGDGHKELLVSESDWRGAPYDNDAAVAVFPGRPGGVDFGNRTYFFPENPPYREFGQTMRAIGDNDRDGLEEVLDGNQRYNGNLGAAAIFEGEANSTNVSWPWSINGSINARYGGHAEGGADVTGDGRNDLVLMLPSINQSTGAVHVFAGQSNGSYPPNPTAVLGGRAPGENFGEDAALCDVDGDAVDDLVVGADHFNSDSEGGAYLFTGGDLSDSAGSFFRGGAAGRAEAFGSGTRCLGDLNGDGFEDFGVWLQFGYNGTTQPGAVRVYYGTAQPFAQNVSITLGGSALLARSGGMKGSSLVGGFGAAIDSYLAAHTAEADPSGNVQVPITVRFEGGGKLLVSQFFVRYSVVLSPQGVQVVSAPSGDALIVSWAARTPASDGDRVAVFSNKSGVWAQLAVVGVPRTSFADLDVHEGVPVHYWVKEWDPLVDLYSGPSAEVVGVPRDVVAPAAPAAFSVAVDAAGHSATLRWARNLDDTVGYEVWREEGDAAGFARIGTVDQPGVAYFDSGLAEERNYTYKVRAVDDVGLASPFTEPGAARISDSVAPPSPRGLRADAAPSGTAIALSWTANAEDTVGYAVWASAPGSPSSYSEAGQTAGTAFTVTGLQRGATYYLRVEAVDGVGQRSAPASTWVSTVDVEAPLAPVITSAEALPEGGAVRLNWTASDDDIAVFHIAWRSGGVDRAAPGVDGSERNFTLSDLTNDVRLDVRISAEDKGGLVGAASEAVSVTPHDSVPPSQPTGVQVEPVASGGALAVTWTGSPDASVAGYKVYYRATAGSAKFLLAGAVSAGATTFTHRGLQNLVSYTYEVAAIDGAANEGAWSAPAQGVPRDLQPPDPPQLEPLPARTNTAGLLVTGHAQAGAQVDVEVGGHPAASQKADGNGAFAITIALAEGPNRVRARVFDASGSAEATAKFSAYSPEVEVVLDQAAPQVTAVSPENGARGLPPSLALTFSLSEPLDGATVAATLRDADGNEIRVAAVYDSARRMVTVTPAVLLTSGTQYTATLRGADAAGNAMAEVSVSFATEPAGSDLTLYLLSAGIGGAAVGAAVIVRRGRGKARPPT